MNPLYLMYSQDHPKQPLAEQAACAASAYAARFGRAASIVLVAADTPDPLPAGTRRAPNVRPGVVWAGEEER